ncbi:MAG: hypothetical protein K5769_11580 [Pseudobutyrivibrio sp.]|nr:hypothetical protein [Pseudobutyrivibrio sp.]
MNSIFKKNNKCVLVAYVYILLNFIGACLHIFSSFKPYITLGVDVFFYVITISILMFFYSVLKKESNDCFNSISRVICGTIAVDIIEVFICIFSTGYEDIPKLIFVLTFIAKALLNFDIVNLILNIAYEACMKIENLEYKTDDFNKFKIAWKICNGIIVAVVLPICYAITKPLWLVVLAFVFMTLYSTSLISKANKVITNKEFENIEYKERRIIPTKVKKLIFIGGLAVLMVFVPMFLARYYSDAKGKFYLVNSEGKLLTEQESSTEFKQVTDEIYQYTVTNRMPEWSGFNIKKYGLVNIKTKDNTGAIYDGEIFFDDEGIAWDYDSHFINKSGKQLFRAPKIVNRKISTKQDFYNSILKTKDEKENKSVRSSFLDNCCRTECELNGALLSYFFVSENSGWKYFVNGIGVYHCDYNDSYGLCNDKGETITSPIYKNIVPIKDNILFAVETKDGMYNFINPKGDTVFKEDFDWIVDIDLSKQMIAACRRTDELRGNEDNHIDYSDCYVYKYSFDGTKYTGVYYVEDFIFKENCLRKITDGKEVAVAVYKGEEIFESEKYINYDFIRDEDNSVKYLIAYLGEEKSDGKAAELIDLEGNIITSEGYYYIASDKDYVASRNDAGNIAITDLNGDTVYTDYKYSSYEGDNIIKVVKDKQYNCIDVQGNLLLDEYCDSIYYYEDCEIIVAANADKIYYVDLQGNILLQSSNLDSIYRVSICEPILCNDSIYVGTITNSDKEGYCLIHWLKDWKEIFSTEVELSIVEGWYNWSGCYGVDTIDNSKDRAEVFFYYSDSASKYRIYNEDGKFVGAYSEYHNYLAEDDAIQKDKNSVQEKPADLKEKYKYIDQFYAHNDYDKRIDVFCVSEMHVLGEEVESWELTNEKNHPEIKAYQNVIKGYLDKGKSNIGVCLFRLNNDKTYELAVFEGMKSDDKVYLYTCQNDKAVQIESGNQKSFGKDGKLKYSTMRNEVYLDRKKYLFNYTYMGVQMGSEDNYNYFENEDAEGNTIQNINYEECEIVSSKKDLDDAFYKVYIDE